MTATAMPAALMAARFVRRLPGHPSPELFVLRHRSQVDDGEQSGDGDHHDRDRGADVKRFSPIEMR